MQMDGKLWKEKCKMICDICMQTFPAFPAQKYFIIQTPSPTPALFLTLELCFLPCVVKWYCL